MPNKVPWTQTTVVAALRDWVQRYGETPTAVDWDRSKARRAGEPQRLARLAEHPSELPSVSNVLARFGSWKAAVQAAGLAPRSQTRRLPDGDLRETAALYESGLSTLQVAERLGLAPKTVRDRLHASGIALRQPRPRSRAMPEPACETGVLEASRDGATQREIAARFGISLYRTQQILARHDIARGPLARRLRGRLSRIDDLGLTARQRIIIELVLAQRQTQRETAEQLAISPTTVTAELRRVAARLQSDEG